MCKKLIFLTSVALVLALAGTNVAFGDTLERTIAADSDDAEEDIGGSASFVMDLTSSDLEFSYDNDPADPLDLQLAGIRFVDIAIPKGSIITSASVQFQADDVDDPEHVGDAYVIIEGELSPNPGTFLEDAFNISLRPRTTALVPWGPAHWTVKGDKYSTPDITSIIQEIVDQPDWASGNALVLIFSQDPVTPSTGVVEAEAGPGDDAALLRIEYVVEPAPAPPEPEPAPPEPEPAPPPEPKPAPPTPGVVERRVAADTDDAEEDLDALGKMELDSSDLELGWEKSWMDDKQVVGLRFTDITIPKGTEIKDAWVQFEVDETKGGTYPVFLAIYGELSADAATFSKDARDITGRPRTTAGAFWFVPNWTVKKEQGPAQQTPDIADIIQEIVDQDDWVSGNSLVLIFDHTTIISTGTRCAESFEGKADAAPLLYIKRTEAVFTVEAGGDIAAANAAATAGDVIDIAAGTFLLTEQIEIKDGVTYQGAGADLTVIDGNNLTRAFFAWGDRSATNGQVDADGAGVPNLTGPTGWVLDGMTIQNCVSDTENRQDILSAARDLLNNYTGAPYTLVTAQEENGGITDNPGWFDILSGSADDDLTDAELQAYLDANPVFSAGHLVVNDDKRDDGGAVCILNGADGTIRNCTFSNN